MQIHLRLVAPAEQAAHIVEEGEIAQQHPHRFPGGGGQTARATDGAVNPRQSAVTENAERAGRGACRAVEDPDRSRSPHEEQRGTLGMLAVTIPDSAGNMQGIERCAGGAGG